MFQELQLGNRGDPVTADWLNRGPRELNRRRPSAVSGQVIGHPIGESGEEASARVGVFSLYGGLGENGWMQCLNLQTGTYTYIAAPVEFRKKIWNGARRRAVELDRTIIYTYGPSPPEFPDEPTYHTTRRIATVLQTGEKFIEVIKPDYRWQNVGDPESTPNPGDWDGYPIIVAAKTGPDGTGITSPERIPDTDPVEYKPVVWMDLNWAGRQWHMVPSELLPT